MPHGDIIERLACGELTTEIGAAVGAAGLAVASGADDPDAVERAVFGIDFSPASLGAARWVAAHLRRGGATRPSATEPPRPARPARALDACFVHVVPWPDGRADLDVALHDAAPDDDRPLREIRPALLGGLAGFAASLRLERVRPVVRMGSPSARLSEVAAADGARLVVLGRRRDAARQRIGEPNVVQRVARRAACDVLVVPEGTQGALEHVIAAVDASPAAQPVVARALALAHSHGAALTLVHVLSPSHGSYDRLTRRSRDVAAPRAPRPAAGEAVHRDTAYAWLAWLARDAGGSVDCRLAVPIGDPARELTALAARRGPSVVVVGKRGAHEVPRGSLGSVAHELVARSPLPVLAVGCAEADAARAD